MTASDADRAKAAEPLTALEWLRVTHADTLSGRRIEEAIAAERAAAVADLRARVEALAEELELDGHRFACVPDPYATGLGDARHQCRRPPPRRHHRHHRRPRVTAPDARQSEELREAIARALHSVGYRGTDSAVAALLPVVTAWAESLARERAAEAWDEAADELELSGRPANHWAVVGFRRRADALAADDQPVQP